MDLSLALFSVFLNVFCVFSVYFLSVFSVFGLFSQCFRAFFVLSLCLLSLERGIDKMDKKMEKRTMEKNGGTHSREMLKIAENKEKRRVTRGREIYIK